ncbi:MAG: Zn-dependent hydrolase, partial [Acidobacteria bacterium]
MNGLTEMALIDAGVGLEVERIVANIHADGFDPDKLKYVLLTHAHAD